MLQKYQLRTSICVISLLVSGCSMISASKKAFIDDVLTNTPDRHYIEKSREAIAREDINDHIKEWEALAPDIKKVISLSQEFDYLLQQMNSAARVHSIKEDGSRDLLAQLDTTNSPTLLTSVPTPLINTAKPANLQTQIDDKFSTSNNSSVIPPPVNVNNVLVGKALPLPNTKDDKFRSGNSVMVNDAATSAELSKATFTELSSNECENRAVEVDQAMLNGTNFAVHLASYSGKKSLKTGYAQLKTKFEEPLCGKVGLFKSVNVKGKNYFSLRLGPFAVKAEAQQACLAIVNKDSYCTVTTFEGQQVL